MPQRAICSYISKPRCQFRHRAYAHEALEDLNTSSDRKVALITGVAASPLMIQLLIMYYIVFASPNVSKQFVAILSFGINSAAYVAEIFRSGIMSIDNGQFEAGRSLGFSYAQTMVYIIIFSFFSH